MYLRTRAVYNLESVGLPDGTVLVTAKLLWSYKLHGRNLVFYSLLGAAQPVSYLYFTQSLR